MIRNNRHGYLLLYGLAKKLLEHWPALIGVVMLALGFLLMIGTVLIAEGFGAHVPKGYIYTAMAFSAGVEGLNIWARRRRERAALASSSGESTPAG